MTHYGSMMELVEIRIRLQTAQAALGYARKASQHLEGYLPEQIVSLEAQVAALVDMARVAENRMLAAA